MDKGVPWEQKTLISSLEQCWFNRGLIIELNKTHPVGYRPLHHWKPHPTDYFPHGSHCLFLSHLYCSWSPLSQLKKNNRSRGLNNNFIIGNKSRKKPGNPWWCKHFFLYHEFYKLQRNDSLSIHILGSLWPTRTHFKTTTLECRMTKTLVIWMSLLHKSNPKWKQSILLWSMKCMP